MIEDKKIGLKIGDEMEALWKKTLEVTQERIKETEKSLVIEKEFAKMCEEKVKEFENKT